MNFLVQILGVVEIAAKFLLLLSSVIFYCRLIAMVKFSAKLSLLRYSICIYVVLECLENNHFLFILFC